MINWLLGVIAAVFVMCYWHPITQFFRFVLLSMLIAWLSLMFIFFATALFVCEKYKALRK